MLYTVSVSKCNKNGVIWSECVTITEESKAETERNDIMYPRNPNECVLVSDLE